MFELGVENGIASTLWIELLNSFNPEILIRPFTLTSRVGGFFSYTSLYRALPKLNTPRLEIYDSTENSPGEKIVKGQLGDCQTSRTGER